jgi:hypothetical protein
MPKPLVTVPENCKANGQVVKEGNFKGVAGAGRIVVYIACGGLNAGALQKVYESPKMHDPPSADQLEQAAGLAEISIKAACHNCLCNPDNRTPDDASELDRPPRSD